jgi:hypothetical protein
VRAELFHVYRQTDGNDEVNSHFCGFTNAPTKQHKEIKNYSKENFEKCCVICWRHAVREIVTTQRITVGMAAKC